MAPGTSQSPVSRLELSSNYLRVLLQTGVTFAKHLKLTCFLARFSASEDYLFRTIHVRYSHTS